MRNEIVQSTAERKKKKEENFDVVITNDMTIPLLRSFAFTVSPARKERKTRDTLPYIIMIKRG